MTSPSRHGRDARAKKKQKGVGKLTLEKIKEIKNRIVVVIAHRLGTVMNANQMGVL